MLAITVSLFGHAGWLAQRWLAKSPQAAKRKTKCLLSAYCHKQSYKASYLTRFQQASVWYILKQYSPWSVLVKVGTWGRFTKLQSNWTTCNESSLNVNTVYTPVRPLTTLGPGVKGHTFSMRRDSNNLKKHNFESKIDSNIKLNSVEPVLLVSGFQVKWKWCL